MKSKLDELAKKITQQCIGSECTQPFSPECDVYKVLGKIYLMSFELVGIGVLNLKVDPIDGEMLRDLYPFIRTGYHMNKRHWISVYEHEKMDVNFIEELILSSYSLVVSKMNKTDQTKIAIMQAALAK